MIGTRPTESPMGKLESLSPTLEDFFEHIRWSNPFDVNRVVGVFAETGDVAAIHDRPFRQLLELAGRAARQHPGIGAVLWGEPGVGKSHVLARFGNWAGLDNERAILIYLANLQASPEALPRSLLRCVLSMLTRGQTRQFHLTALYRLVLAAIQRALRSDGTRRFTEPEAIGAYQELLNSHCAQDPQAALVDRTIYDVLFRFWRSALAARHGPEDGLAALAVRWLAGDSLETDEARALGIPRPARNSDAVALPDDQQIKNVLLALTQLASWWGRPIVLCFDQVDTLDEEQIAALTRFLHGLLDSAGNLLVITSGVQPTLLGWKNDRVIAASTWDRLAQYEIEVQGIDDKQARLLVQTRLQPFQERFRALEPIWKVVQRDLLFPLGESWAAQLLADRITIRPRDVINWAREGWRREQETLNKNLGEDWLRTWPHTPQTTPPPAAGKLQDIIDTKVAAKLQEHRQQRLLEPHSLPPDADNLAGLLHRLLERCLNVREFPSLLGVEMLKAQRNRQPPPYQLLLRQKQGDGNEYRTGLLCLSVSDRKAMAAFLRRLVQGTQPIERLILVTDERRPLDPATAGGDYLEKLRKRHGDRLHQVTLPLVQYAELDALQASIGLARSGDLEVELPGGFTRPVLEKEVIESHLRRQCYLAHPLLKLLLTGEMPTEKREAREESLVRETDDQDLRQFIMGRLAISMGISSKELAVQYQAYLKIKEIDLALAVCKARLETAARRLHQEGKVNATPHDDYLYLLLK
jgi:hypothetical protein